MYDIPPRRAEARKPNAHSGRSLSEKSQTRRKPASIGPPIRPTVSPEFSNNGDYEEWRLLGCYAVWLL
jgi:hypothetical protein